MFFEGDFRKSVYKSVNLDSAIIKILNKKIHINKKNYKIENIKKILIIFLNYIIILDGKKYFSDISR